MRMFKILDGLEPGDEARIKFAYALGFGIVIGLAIVGLIKMILWML